MADSTRQSEVILREAKDSLATQRQGGYHRRAGSRSIGRGSAELRRKNLLLRLKLIVGSAVAIVAAMIAAGLILDGIGFVGVMLTLAALFAAIAIFASLPLQRTPKREDLARTADARQLIARTELWLEHQRPALPPPAVTLVDQIGVQLDALGLQLEHVDPVHPAAVETRKLVGETLPGMVEAYRKIPAHMRHEERAGATPERQLTESLGKISAEIDRVTRQLADGALDDLAIRTRYLEYKYGDAAEPAS